jgi:hypothetical protein
MNERRYNEEEVAAIFRLAAETREAAAKRVASPSGLTLAELKQIGGEVGIAPEDVEAAAASLKLATRPATRRFFGLPISVGRTLDLQRNLSESEWEQLVVDLRETFDARGNVSSDGAFRQWTNGNLQVLLEPTASGHRLRLRTLKGSSRSLMITGLGLLGASVATTLAVVLTRPIVDLASLSGTILMSTGGLLMFAMGAVPLPAWARLRLRQMDAVIARLAPVQNAAVQSDDKQR